MRSVVCVASFNCLAITRWPNARRMHLCVGDDRCDAYARTQTHACIDGIDACAQLNDIYVSTGPRSRYSSGSALCENVRVRVYHICFSGINFLIGGYTTSRSNRIDSINPNLRTRATHHQHIVESNFYDRSIKTKRQSFIFRVKTNVRNIFD